MNMGPQLRRSVRDQVWGAVDPKGDTRALVNAAIHSPSALEWMALLGVDLTEKWSQVGSAGAGYRGHIADIEAALQTLVPRGWALMLMQTDAINKAVRLVQEGKENEADELLADQWGGVEAWRTKRVCDRVRLMGAGDSGYGQWFEERARLIMKAREHHEAGRYDASILLLQAQMEGIVMDVVPGKKFFTKGTQKADLVDPTQLVSIEASLAALQATYGQDVKETQAKGDLSRHGIAHGRELAYDTRTNSAKTWSVMDALVSRELSNLTC